MKAQISLELYFVFLILIIIIGWMANLINYFHSNTPNYYTQQQVALQSFANIINENCINQVEGNYLMPCVLKDGNPIQYGISFSNGMLTMSSNDTNETVSVQSLCGINPSSISFACGQTACLEGSNGSVNVTLGGC
ncbi:MAG: hypothetical protein M1594_00845 [Candidatus Marsarchaeota archaeon]|nr:hypothetical protein [Candidatus Marsarchaeota archaeon]